MMNARSSKASNEGEILSHPWERLSRKILWRLCVDYVYLLCAYCVDCVYLLCRLCVVVMFIMCRNYPMRAKYCNTHQGKSQEIFSTFLCRFYAFIVFVLCTYCVAIMFILCRLCVVVMFIMCSYCEYCMWLLCLLCEVIM